MRPLHTAPKSPDLNPIENLGVVKSRMKVTLKFTVKHVTVDHLVLGTKKITSIYRRGLFFLR